MVQHLRKISVPVLADVADPKTHEPATTWWCIIPFCWVFPPYWEWKKHPPVE